MTRTAVALLLAGLLGGCGSSPRTHFYTLTPAADGRLAAGGHPIRMVAVGDVRLPAELDRLSLVTQGSGSRIIVSDTDRWAAPLDQLLRRALTADLSARLPPGSVLAPGDPMPRNARVLTLNVRRFMADPSGRVSLDADWAIESGNARTVPHHVSVAADAADTGGEAVAMAMSQAVGKLADRIAAAL